MKNELIFSFEKSLFDSKVKDLTNDIVELGLDSCLEDGLLKIYPLWGDDHKSWKYSSKDI